MNISDQYLKAWLPFNTSATEDAKMNNWQTFGNPTISPANAFNGNALQLDGQSYLKLSGVELGGRDFYIDGWIYVDPSSPNYARIISIVNPSNGYHLVSVRKSPTDATKIDFWRNSTDDVSKNNGYTETVTVTSVGTRVHFSLVYIHARKFFQLYVNDGNPAGTSNDSVQYSRQTFDIYIGASQNGSQGLIGTIDELRIYDGTFLTSGYNNPPTLADYQNIIFDADAERIVKNPLTTWRYENAGTADLLTVSGTTLTDLPVTQSKTGSAFYQTARAKCFDIPATKEIWAKFDVYTTLAQRWRAYNNNTLGVCSYTDGTFTFWNNSTVVKELSGKVKNQLQTVLLHMISDSAEGVIEAWLDGEKLYTYTGNVNNGEDFADFFLQSDGAGTFFSNVIISNAEIALDENVGIHFDVSFDAQRLVGNTVTIDFDAQRIVHRSVILDADAQRIVKKTLTIDFDSCRNVHRTVNFLVDTCRNISHKFIMTPAKDGILYADAEESTGIQSLQIDIAPQQITDQFSFTAVNDVDILQNVKGQYLDYVFDLRIEKITQKGILNTCLCCSDVDKILYTQLAYKVKGTTGGCYIITLENQVIVSEMPKASAHSHISRIADIIGKKLVYLADEFISSIDTEQDGVTYNDLIRDIFGWASRVPTKLINVYIRNDSLYVVQRGHEQNTIDISNAKIANLTITKELFRTTWGSTPNSYTVTQTTGKKYGMEPILRPWQDDDTPPEPSTPSRVLPTYIKHSENGKTTETYYDYDDDGNVTNIHNISPDTETFTYNSYKKKHGRKYLVSESTYTYALNGTLIDEKHIYHSYLEQGQENIIRIDGDGNIDGSITTSAKIDARPTPFEDTKNSEHYYNYNEDNRTYTYVDGVKMEIIGYKEVTYGNEKEITNNGIALYDSSFPIEDYNTLYALTAELRRLNRTTQESVTLDIYDYPHVFDFNDKIIFCGNEYFLDSNSVSKTPRIVNKQSLKLVRWF